MRASLLAFLAAASSVFAQNDSSYIPDLLNNLTAAGLSNLTSLASSISNTTTGQALLADLPIGNKTLFAPNNQAFSGTPPSNITDPNQLADILSYHVATGSFPDFASAPNHTILRTALNSTQFVTLEGNKSQVLVLSTVNGTARVLQQNTPVSVISTTTFRNLVIHVVDAVIDFPPPLSLAIASHNLSSLTAAAQQAGLVQNIEAAHGITIFAPTDSAFTAVNQSIGNNQTLLQNLLNNHIINGTSAYSTLLSSGNYTSGAGEPFTFNTNDSGTFVFSGPSTARIIQSDVIVSNGVVHIIDNVLLNTQNDTQAASSAFESATSVAAQSTTETTGVGATATGSNLSPSSTGPQGGGGGGGGGSGSGAVALEVSSRQWGIASILVLAGGAVAF